ncbi:MAG TPA: hypothetical protein VFL41_06935 [Gaiellaceae bacterium]|nr:hypothetical protein [Gaiellaceae bacterium]
MSEGSFGPLLPRQRRSRRRRNKLVPWAVRGAAAVVVFALGVAFGQALESDSGEGGSRTYVRTLVPETLPPETATVTVTTP